MNLLDDRLYPPERSVSVRELLNALPPNASLDWWRAEYSQEIGDIVDGQSNRQEFERDLIQSGRTDLLVSIPLSEELAEVRNFGIAIGGSKEINFDVWVRLK